MSDFSLSQRARLVGVSSTLAVSERLAHLKKEGRDIIALGAGQPDFESPPAALEAGKRAIEQGHTRYTPSAGNASLREIIAEKFRVENDLAVTAEQVVVSAGAKQSLFHVLLALVDTDDEVFFPVPAWPSYAEMVRLAGGHPHLIPTDASTGYKLTAEALVRTLQQTMRKPTLLMLNNPCNPTGAMYHREELERLAEVIRGEDLHVIMDEIYEHLTYEGEFVSLATLPGMRQRTVTINGMSKAFSMTGWRIGYATGPAPVIRAMKAIQSHASGNPTSISQDAAEAALRAHLAGGAGREPMERMKSAFTKRRELLCRLLPEIPEARFVPPAGGFYFFVDLSAHYGKELGGKTVRSSKEMAEYLLESAGVGVIPGDDFGDDRSVRISFATSAEDLTVGVHRITRALGGAPGPNDAGGD